MTTIKDLITWLSQFPDDCQVFVNNIEYHERPWCSYTDVYREPFVIEPIREDNYQTSYESFETELLFQGYDEQDKPVYKISAIKFGKQS